jgi:hypothetical protein
MGEYFLVAGGSESWQSHNTERSPLAKAAAGLLAVVANPTRGFKSLPSPPLFRSVAYLQAVQFHQVQFTYFNRSSKSCRTSDLVLKQRGFVVHEYVS